MTEIRQGESSEMDLRRERKDFYALRFWIDNFPDSDLQPGDDSARGMIKALPLWKKRMKKQGPPNFGFHPEIVDSMDVEYVTDFADRYAREATIPEEHGEANLARERKYWEVRQEIGRRALEIGEEAASPVK